MDIVSWKARIAFTVTACAMAFAPAGAQQAEQDAHRGHGKHHQTDNDTEQEVGPDAILIAYRDALIALDLEAAGENFAADARVFENGKAEGSWADYAEHHLGPELGHFSSFSFPTYEIEIRKDGDFAFGEERYSYRIELSDGRVIERVGVATSVLRNGLNGWRITSYHSSSRAPRKK